MWIRFYGVDGLIIPDLPLEEQEELQTQLQKEDGTILIQLVSPVSKDRVPKILKNARGFVYCVSSMGVTGQEATFHRQILEYLTAITAWMMVYVMTVYNTVLATGSFTNTTFLIALKGMWIEYIIIGLLAYFVSGHLSKMCAFRVVQPGDRPIFIIFAIQTFTVIWQVAFASVIGVYHGHGFTANFTPDYLMTSDSFGQN